MGLDMLCIRLERSSFRDLSLIYTTMNQRVKIIKNMTNLECLTEFMTKNNNLLKLRCLQIQILVRILHN